MIATNIFAPDEIPSTNGPAIGFLKNVCNRNPDNDKAPPKIAAIHNRGSRIFQIILYSGVPISPFKNIILKILAGDIWILPVLIFNITATTSNTASSIYTSW